MTTEPDDAVPSAIGRLLAEARSHLDRVTADELPALLDDDAVLVVDTRPVELRERDGVMPGAVVVDRNVLEWRLDPTSPHRLPEVDDARRVVLFCDEGYASSLAARSLQWLGVDATDVDGGYQAWKALGDATAAG